MLFEARGWIILWTFPGGLRDLVITLLLLAAASMGRKGCVIRSRDLWWMQPVTSIGHVGSDGRVSDSDFGPNVSLYDLTLSVASGFGHCLCGHQRCPRRYGRPALDGSAVFGEQYCLCCHQPPRYRRGEKNVYPAPGGFGVGNYPPGRRVREHPLWRCSLCQGLGRPGGCSTGRCRQQGWMLHQRTGVVLSHC